ncbi:hypothetical protein SPI_05768 [Niveomyces insectorum RCEF 264]|uniref:Rhodopsin domain-containing protein n=1 Tax=Niveomyces insectorum RCEF 264 TaxID=1081102 RepID=A0A167SF65_9HYPO|nr:hypothetical protein SPI_05768 [Niveomyces insectorum RCEF 264]
MSLTTAAASAVATTLATLTSLATSADTLTPTTPTATGDVPTAAATPGAGAGPVHHHHHHHAGSRRGVIIGVISFILPFTAAVVLLRFYTRHYLSRAVGADDWMMLVSLILAIVDGTTMLLMTTRGLGHHMWTVSADAVKTYNMYFYLSIVFYYSCLGTVKTAILLQYLRVFAVKMRKITLVALVLIGLWSTALVLVSVFACRPIRGFWDHTVPATCVPDLPQWYVNAAGNIATDVIIFTLPIPVLWRLNLPRTQRLSLIAIFGLGFFTCTISVIRITFLNLNGDDTYANVAAACWSIAELCCAIVCSSLPTLRPVFFRLLPAPLRQHHQHHHQFTERQHPPPPYRPSVYLAGLGEGGHDSPAAAAAADERSDSPMAGAYPLKRVHTGPDGARGRRSPPDLEDTPSTTTTTSAWTTDKKITDKTATATTTTADSKTAAAAAAASYYNRFYHHFHPHDSGVVPFAARTSMSTSTRTSISSGSSGGSSDDEGNGRSGRGRLECSGPKSSHGQSHSRSRSRSSGGSRRWLGVRDGVVANPTAAATPPHAHHADPEKQALAADARLAVPSLPTSPSRRSLRDLVSGGTYRSYRSSNSNSRSTSPKSASRSAPPPPPLPPPPPPRRPADNSSGDTLDAAVPATATAAAAGFTTAAPETGSAPTSTPATASATASATSSSAPTRAHTPSPPPTTTLSLPPPPPRTYSYSHLRRMAAAVVGAGTALPGGNNSSNSGPLAAASSTPLGSQLGGPPGAAPAPTTTTPPLATMGNTGAAADPHALDRDAYLGLRQGTVTSIEATRPSTAEAEAAGWERPTGTGIQIRREVAQNVGPA